MWPWEHAAFGYLVVSLCWHLWRRESPDGKIALAATFGAVFPDLVDKPLSWSFGVFSSGYAVAHSAFVFPLFAAALWAGLRRYNAGAVAIAFLVGHVTHLVGDVIYPFVMGDELALSAVLWPVVVTTSSPTEAGLVARTLYYLHEWVVRLWALELGPLLLFEMALVGVVVGVWLYDGAPVLSEIRTYLSNQTE